ncbi:unnamed protein product [Ixodes persulcatus]
MHSMTRHLATPRGTSVHLRVSLHPTSTAAVNELKEFWCHVGPNTKAIYSMKHITLQAPVFIEPEIAHNQKKHDCLCKKPCGKVQHLCKQFCPRELVHHPTAEM